MNDHPLKNVVAVAGALLVLSSCQKRDEVRRYEEIVVTSPVPPAPAGDAKLPLSWSTPEGWIEKPGDGMRLATFVNTDAAGKDRIECSIVSLGGQAGGMKANVFRWMKQINIPAPADEELDQFLSGQKEIRSRSGLAGTLIDFTPLQSLQPADVPSMIAAIIETPQAVVFVKMTGAKAALSNHRAQFEHLCRSLEVVKISP